MSEGKHVSSVELSTLTIGFQEAYNRFILAQSTNDPVRIFIPLFEVLNWSVSIDDKIATQFGKDWHQHYDPIVAGIRFARNCVHHQWAGALYLDAGLEFPIHFPLTFQEWRWKPDLPPGDRPNPHGESVYKELLASKPARLTLARLNSVYEKVMEATSL